MRVPTESHAAVAKATPLATPQNGKQDVDMYYVLQLQNYSNSREEHNKGNMKTDHSQRIESFACICRSVLGRAMVAKILYGEYSLLNIPSLERSRAKMEVQRLRVNSARDVASPLVSLALKLNQSGDELTTPLQSELRTTLRVNSRRSSALTAHNIWKRERLKPDWLPRLADAAGVFALVGALRSPAQYGSNCVLPMNACSVS